MTNFHWRENTDWKNLPVEEEVKKEVEGLALLNDDALGDKTSAPTLNSLIFTIYKKS